METHNNELVHEIKLHWLGVEGRRAVTQTWDVGLQHFQVPSKVCTGETKEKLSITFNNFANLTSGMLENFKYILKKKHNKLSKIRIIVYIES